MKKLPIFIACLVALVALAVGACGPVAGYAATVNGTRLSQDDLNLELEAIRDNKEYAAAVEQQLAQGGEKLKGSGKSTFDATFVARVLTRQIFLALVSEGVEEKDLEVTEKDLDEARQQQVEQFEQQFGTKDVWESFPAEYQDTLVRRSAEIQVLQEGLAPKIDDAAIKSYYEEHISDFAETCSRHILAPFPGDRRDPATPPPTPEEEAAAKAKAEEWKRRIEAGEDFAAIAQAESGDPGSGAQGGDLGCRGGFVPEFTEAMETLEPNQVSGPVRTQFGYHIIQVTSRQQKSLEEARPEIEQALSQEAQGSIQTYLEKAIEEAEIKVNPKYGSFDKGDPAKGEQPQVVPPKGPATTTTTGPRGVEDEAPGMIPEGEGGAGS